MRIIVSIQVVKNGYLVSYTNRKAINTQPSTEMDKFIPMQRQPQTTIPVEESVIITDEQEIVALLRQLRSILNES